MKHRVIFYFLGRILLIMAAFMIAPLAIAVYQQETASAFAFLATIIIVFTTSIIFGFISKNKIGKDTIYAREGFVTVTLGWVAVSFFGALPFFFSGAIPNFLDCWFETVSGFTTTGASILTQIEGLPLSILFWRSFTHWVGGMGILVFMLAVVPASKADSLHILRAESPGPEVGKLVPTIRSTARMLYKIYIGLTIIEIILLFAGGMPLYDSLVHTFGTAGTGGFSIKNASIAAYDSFYLQGVISVFMLLFGINFNIFYILLLRDFKSVFKNEELLTYLGIVAATTTLIALNIRSNYETTFEAFHHSFFQVSSIMTTTGYATADFNLWPEFSRILLVTIMVIGACAGSTGGGVKVSRALILFKSAKNEMQKLLHPRMVKPVRMDGRVIETSVVHNVHTFFAIYCMLCGVSFLIVSLDNLSFDTTITAVIACINNIGPGLGDVGAVGNYAGLSYISKFVLSINMLFGRLEIFPMMILIAPSTWRRYSI